MKRQQLKARVVSKKEVKRIMGGGKKGWGRREYEREGVADIGRAQATAVVWMKNPKNVPSWVNSGQMLH